MLRAPRGFLDRGGDAGGDLGQVISNSRKWVSSSPPCLAIRHEREALRCRHGSLYRWGETGGGGATMSTVSTSRPEGSIRDPLPRLRKQLAEEYRDQPGDRIDEAAKHALDRFGGAKVREFVPILAWRHARQHLRSAS